MKSLIAILSVCLLMITGLGASANAFAAMPPENNGMPQNSLSPMLKHIMPAVVNIAAQGEILVPTPARKNAENKGESATPYGIMREFASLGSGVIIDASKGYILTNAHVINKAKTITVNLSDGRTFKAKLIGADAASDIAVIQISAEKLSAMPVGNSDNLQVGDFVVAIGNPFGLNQTVTSGIVSALQRSSLGIEGPQGLENFIQTDASINPGNSGGALVNLKGQLIGINTAIISSDPSGGNIGIGFAIPINLARTIMAQLIEYGAVKRGLMGIIVQDLTPDLANAFDLPNAKGALVTQVSPNSPAAKADLMAGDIIQTINGQKMLTAAAVRNAVGLLRVGAKIDVELLRHGKPISATLVTADPEHYIEQAQAQNPFLFGLAFRNFDQQMPLQGHIMGIQIVHVSKNSAAWRAGLAPGDVIVSANQEAVTTIDALEKAAAANKKRLLLNVIRNGGAMFVVLD